MGGEPDSPPAPALTEQAATAPGGQKVGTDMSAKKRFAAAAFVGMICTLALACPPGAGTGRADDAPCQPDADGLLGGAPAKAGKPRVSPYVRLSAPPRSADNT